MYISVASVEIISLRYSSPLGPGSMTRRFNNLFPSQNRSTPPIWLWSVQRCWLWFLANAFQQIWLSLRTSSEKKKKKKHFTSVFQAQLGLLDGVFNAFSYIFTAKRHRCHGRNWHCGQYPQSSHIPNVTNTYVTQHVHVHA